MFSRIDSSACLLFKALKFEDIIVMARKKLKRLNGKVVSFTGKKDSRKTCKTKGFKVSPMLEDEGNSHTVRVELNPSLAISKDLVNSWEKGKKVSKGPFEFDPLPFKHGIIDQLIINEQFLDKLSSELLQLPFERMSNDLYSFRQTDSLFNQKGSVTAVKSALALITGPLQSWVERVTGKNFSKKVTATASLYGFTDRLLCHDDNLSDRSVAFIFYLCKNWKNENGGSLDLFKCDSENQPTTVVKSIFPKYGSFAFFEVTNSSYHQVAEILSSKCSRLSINGWFHGQDLPEQIKWHEPLPKMYTPIHPKGCSLLRWVNPSWLNGEAHDGVKDTFCKELNVALPNFLKPETYRDLLEALKLDSIAWSPCGPANKRRFEVADASSLSAIWKDFLKLLQSKYWFKLLSQFTVDIDPNSPIKPKCFFELQRWQPGDYTLLIDDDPINKVTGIDLHLYFGVSKKAEDIEGGEVYYLGPERDTNGYLEESAQIEPHSNVATFIARIEGMASVTKYLNHQKTSFYKIFAHYTQG